MKTVFIASIYLMLSAIAFVLHDTQKAAVQIKKELSRIATSLENRPSVVFDQLTAEMTCKVCNKTTGGTP